MIDEVVKRKVEKLQVEIIATYAESKEHMSATLSMLCSTLGSMLAHICADESVLLDGIDLAHKQIRECATDGYVKKQRLIKAGQYSGK